MDLGKLKIVVDKVAFEGDERGFHFKGTYLKEPKGYALVEISKDEQIVRKFLFPGYKIWNIAAHAEEIVAGLIQDSDAGLHAAGSDGIGGNAYSS